MFYIVDYYLESIKYESENREDCEKELKEMEKDSISIWSIVEADTAIEALMPY